MAEESHRLKPMVSNYDEKLFNELYSKTQALRNSLVHGIDPNRFGVDSEELSSWFTVKFIYIFNKYHEQHKDAPGRLLGNIINGLKMYKQRLILEAYAKKNEVYATNSIDDYLGHGEFEDFHSSELPIDDPLNDSYEYKETLLKSALTFLRGEISDDALYLLELQLNPPPYIISRMQELEIHNLHKIPDELIVEYMDVDNPDKLIGHLKVLKNEIKHGVIKAQSISNNLIFSSRRGN